MSPLQRWWRIGIATAVLVPCVLLGLRLRIESDIGRMLPRGGDLARIAEVLQQLTARTVVDIGSETGAVPLDELCAFAVDFAERLARAGVVAVADARVQAGALDLVPMLRQHAPVLFDAAALDQAIALLDPATVDVRIGVLRRRLLEPDGAMLRQRAADDPLGITDLALRPLQSLYAGFRDVRLHDGCLVSGDGRHVLVLVTPGFPATDLERGRALAAAVVASAAAVAPAQPEVTVRWLGSHRSTLDNAELIIADVWLVSLAGLIASTAIAVLFLGLRFALLSLVPAACGAVVALAALTLLRGEVSGAALGFGSVLCGLCLDFTVHVLFTAPGADRGPRRVSYGVVFLAAGSTAAAQLVLLGASLPGLCDVGLFGAVATASAAVFAVWLLPALLPAVGRPVPLVDLQALLARVRVPRRAIVTAVLLAVPVLAWFATGVGVDGDVRALSAVTPANTADEQAITVAWGDALSAAVLVVETPELEAALQRNEELAAWLTAALARGLVRDYSSVAGLLPAERTQQQRLAAWRDYCTQDRRALVAAALASAATHHGFKAAAFAPFLAFLAAPPTLLPTAALLDLGGPIADKVQRTTRGWRILTPVFVASPERREALRTALAEECDGVLLVERGELVRALLAMVTGDAWWLGAAALLVVVFVLGLSQVRLELTLLVVVPLLLGLLATLGLMGLCGIQLTLANSAFAVFLFGIAVDYAIILLHARLDRFRSGEDETSTACASVLFCGLTTLCGFGVLAFAGHPVLRSMGLTALLGIGATLVTSLAVVPLLADAVLVRRGPNGSPALRHLFTATWVSVVLAGGSLWFRICGRRTLDAAAAQQAALAMLRHLSLRIRYHLPLGTRTYRNEERLPAKPCVYVANHESMYDTVAVMALPRPLQMLVKRWVWRAPLIGPAVRAAGFLLIGDADLASLVAQARQSFAAGVSVFVFPEGTRSRDGRVGRFHSGAFQLAAQLDVPVVPIALAGTRHVVPRSSWWVGDHDASITVLDPVEPRDFPGELGHLAMAKHVRQRIAAARDELWAEAPNGRNWGVIVAGAYRYLGPVMAVYAPWKARLDPLVAALPGLLPGAAPILVGGCGYGLMTTSLACGFPGRAVHAIDVDPRKVAIARAAVGDGAAVAFVVGDLRTAALPAVGAAVLVDVLHYWPDAEQREILLAVAGALPAGGQLVCRDGCSDAGSGHTSGSRWEWFAARIGFTRAGTTQCYRSQASWGTLLHECGFRVVATRGDLGRRSDVVFLCEKRNKC